MRIGEDAFYGCDATLYDNSTIKGVSLVNGWAIGHDYSLSGTLDLKGCRGIGANAFSRCGGITSVTIPDSVTSIGNHAFLGCSNLETVTIANSVQNIGDYAFRGCSSIKSLAIPDSVTSIGEYAFYGCTSLKSIHLPARFQGAISDFGLDADCVVNF